MVSDFIKDLRVTEGRYVFMVDETLSADVLEKLTLFIGATQVKVSKDSNRRLSDRTIQKRLEPIAAEFLGLEENDMRYSAEHRREISIIRDRYGIGTRQLSKSAIAKKYGLSYESDVEHIVLEKLWQYGDSDKYYAWSTFLALGAYLCKVDFDCLCEAIRNDTEGQKKYRDHRLLSRCLKNAGLPG